MNSEIQVPVVCLELNGEKIDLPPEWQTQLFSAAVNTIDAMFLEDKAHSSRGHISLVIENPPMHTRQEGQYTI